MFSMFFFQHSLFSGVQCLQTLATLMRPHLFGQLQLLWSVWATSTDQTQKLSFTFSGRKTKKPFPIQVSCFVMTLRPQIAIKLRPNLCPAETLDQVSLPVFQNWALNWPDFRHPVSQHTSATLKKHCQRHYGPRRWLLWPVILVWKVWFSMLNRLSLILLVGSVGRFGLVVLDW